MSKRELMKRVNDLREKERALKLQRRTMELRAAAMEKRQVTRQQMLVGKAVIAWAFSDERTRVALTARLALFVPTYRREDLRSALGFEPDSTTSYDQAEDNDDAS